MKSLHLLKTLQGRTTDESQKEVQPYDYLLFFWDRIY